MPPPGAIRASRSALGLETMPYAPCNVLPPRWRVGPLPFVLVTAALYAAAFLPAVAAMGPAVGAFGVVPVLIAAWGGGRRWGVWTGVVVGGPFHLALYLAALPEMGLLGHVAGVVPSAGTFALMGYGLGRIRELVGAVRANEERFRGMFENAAVGIAQVGLDGTMLGVNGRLCGILGYDRDDLVGRLFADVTHADDVDADLAHARGAVEGGVDAYHREKRCVRRDGRVVWVLLTVSVVRNQSGGPCHLVVVVEDVSERKAAEAAVLESEARYRGLIETVRDGVLQTDLEARWTYLNPAWEEITGYSVAESLGRPASDFMHPDERARNAAAFAPLVAGEVPFVRYETRYLTKGGEVRHVEIHAQLRYDAGGAVVGTTGTVSDITDTVRFEAEREARERSEEMLRLKTSFLNNMSHELRTPLTGILGFADVLAEEAPPELHGPVEAVQRGAERLMDTLTSVLDLAQIEAGGLRLRPAPVDVAAEARAVAGGLAAVAAARGLSLTVEGAGTPAVLDRTALHRVLNNLVGNALKFTDAGGVTVRVGGGGGAVRVEVADTGRGIAAAFLPRLFDEFRQESEGLDRAHEGNGLGLTITKRLVDLMGGAVAVESEAGVGTTFAVTLPAAPPGGDGAAGAAPGLRPSEAAFA